MTLPPPPGSFGQQPPNGGQTGGGAPQPWSQYPGGPTPPPHAGPPPWGPQQQWSNGPTRPPNGGGNAKWILGGLAVVLAISLAVVVTVLVVRPDSGNGFPDAEPGIPPSGFASENDKGPVSIITDDPTCSEWGRITREYNAQSMVVRWAERDVSISASDWTPEQRAMYDTMATAMTNAADQTEALIKQTPHRVMRELYQQFSAYVHAFVPLIPTYVAENNQFVPVINALANSATDICTAVEFKSAATVAGRIPSASPPSRLASISDRDASVLFLDNANAVCTDWGSAVAAFDEQTRAWQNLDPKVPAAEWSSDHRAVMDAVAPVMSANADNLEQLGQASENPIFEDFSVLAAQYQRGYVEAIPSYAPSDNVLWQVVASLVKAINSGCKVSS